MIEFGQQERLPYFFTYGDRAVLCPKCAEEVMEQGDAGALAAHYFTQRSLMCGHCNILIGPINESEAMEV